jgi:hypothetical protein
MKTHGKETFFLSPRIEVRDVAGKGRGVVASAVIALGEIVEVSPLLVCGPGVIPEAGHPLSDHVFAFGKGVALGLGYASLYNHAFQPNCDWQLDKAVPAVRIWAVRAIQAGEELTIDYRIPPWFTPA